MHEHDIEEEEVTALQADELLDLEDWLTCDAVPATAMTLGVMDGFLTALLCGPVMVPPSAWLPLIWDCQGAGAFPTFADSRASGVLIGLIVQRLLDIEAALSQSADQLAPVYQTLPKLLAGSWCAGFLLAMQQAPEAWSTVREANAAAIALLEAEARALSDAATAALRPDPIASIRDIVACALEAAGAAGALARRQTTAAAWALTHDRDPFVREAPKVGRNDVCPCGSGKKFKRCCGRDEAAARVVLH